MKLEIKEFNKAVECLKESKNPEVLKLVDLLNNESASLTYVGEPIVTVFTKSMVKTRLERFAALCIKLKNPHPQDSELDSLLKKITTNPSNYLKDAKELVNPNDLWLSNNIVGYFKNEELIDQAKQLAKENGWQVFTGKSFKNHTVKIDEYLRADIMYLQDIFNVYLYKGIISIGDDDTVFYKPYTPTTTKLPLKAKDLSMNDTNVVVNDVKIAKITRDKGPYGTKYYVFDEILRKWSIFVSIEEANSFLEKLINEQSGQPAGE